MLVALSNPHTPSTLDTNTICVQFAIPVDAAIRAAWLQFAAYLGNPDNWQKDGAIEEYECAALIAGMIENGLNTPCIVDSAGGAMEHISNGIEVNSTQFTIEIPDVDWLYVQLVASLFVPGSTPNDLLGLLPANEARANAHTVIRNTTTATATSGTSSTQIYADFAAAAQNLLASEAEDPPFSQFLWTIHRPRDTDKTVYDGHLYKPSNGNISRFNGKHNFAEAIANIKLSPSAGGLISGSWSLFGVRKNAI